MIFLWHGLHTNMAPSLAPLLQPKVRVEMVQLTVWQLAQEFVDWMGIPHNWNQSLLITCHSFLFVRCWTQLIEPDSYFSKWQLCWQNHWVICFEPRSNVDGRSILGNQAGQLILMEDEPCWASRSVHVSVQSGMTGHNTTVFWPFWWVCHCKLIDFLEKHFTMNLEGKSTQNHLEKLHFNPD